MPVYQRKLKRGNRFYYSGQYLGIRYFSHCIYHTKREAQQEERIKRNEIDDQQTRRQASMKLFELMEKRLDYLKQTKSLKYYRENKWCFSRALEFWGDIEIHSITKAMVSEFMLGEVERLKKDGKNNYHANAILRMLKALFYFGNKVYDLDIKNPCLIDFFSVDLKLKKIPTDEEIEQVKAICNLEEKQLIDFVADTGCRISEAIRLRWEDIDGNLLTLWTRKAKNSNLTPRRIPAPDCLWKIAAKGKVFHWQAHPRFLEKRAAKLGYHWTWHNLRHRRASIWAKQGMPLFEIMVRLGHNNLGTTQKYLQLLGFTSG